MSKQAVSLLANIFRTETQLAFTYQKEGGTVYVSSCAFTQDILDLVRRNFDDIVSSPSYFADLLQSAKGVAFQSGSVRSGLNLRSSEVAGYVMPEDVDLSELLAELNFPVCKV